MAAASVRSQDFRSPLWQSAVGIPGHSSVWDILLSVCQERQGSVVEAQQTLKAFPQGFLLGVGWLVDGRPVRTTPENTSRNSGAGFLDEGIKQMGRVLSRAVVKKRSLNVTGDGAWRGCRTSSWGTLPRESIAMPDSGRLATTD